MRSPVYSLSFPLKIEFFKNLDQKKSIFTLKLRPYILDVSFILLYLFGHSSIDYLTSNKAEKRPGSLLILQACLTLEVPIPMILHHNAFYSFFLKVAQQVRTKDTIRKIRTTFFICLNFGSKFLARHACMSCTAPFVWAHIASDFTCVYCAADGNFLEPQMYMN